MVATFHPTSHEYLSHPTRLSGPISTVFAVGMALERNPPVCRAMARAGWEVASHGYRWWDYQNVEEATEREHIRRTVQIHEEMGLGRPVGMYQGKVRRAVRFILLNDNIRRL